MVELKEMRRGSEIILRPAWGSKPPERARVEAVESNIKNGRPGIDYTSESGEPHWAYLDQVDRVIKY
jgi:hypothetical protein